MRISDWSSDVCSSDLLDARNLAFILEHGEAKVLLTDREFSPVIKEVLALVQPPGARPLVVDIDDPLADGGELLGALDYEALLAEGDPAERFDDPADEWRSISLLYTSGTTGRSEEHTSELQSLMRTSYAVF